MADDLSSGLLENLAAIRSRITFLKGDLRKPEFAKPHAMARRSFSTSLRPTVDEDISTLIWSSARTICFWIIQFLPPRQPTARRKLSLPAPPAYILQYLQSDKDSHFLLKEANANFEEPGKAFADGEYGWAKLMGELQLRAFCKQFGHSGIACRIFTAYGERENESHAVIALIAKAAARLDPFPIWGDGLQTRNFTYVQDTVTGIALAGANLDGFDVVNIGTDMPPHNLRS